MDDEICKQSFRVSTDFAVELVRVFSDTQKAESLTNQIDNIQPWNCNKAPFFGPNNIHFSIATHIG